MSEKYKYKSDFFFNSTSSIKKGGTLIESHFAVSLSEKKYAKSCRRQYLIIVADKSSFIGGGADVLLNASW